MIREVVAVFICAVKNWVLIDSQLHKQRNNLPVLPFLILLFLLLKFVLIKLIKRTTYYCNHTSYNLNDNLSSKSHVLCQCLKDYWPISIEISFLMISVNAAGARPSPTESLRPLPRGGVSPARREADSKYFFHFC